MPGIFFAVKEFVRREEGATLVEYSLMLALIALVCLAAIASVGTGVSTTFTSVSAGF